MDLKAEDIKTLTINGKEYAKYNIDMNILFIKVLINIVPNNTGESEDYLASLIGLIEEKNFTGLSFLNI